MDRLAAEDVRLTHAFTTSPLCVTERISLVTGLYPHNNNCWQGLMDLSLWADTYVKRLKAVGYRTCSIGKNHLYNIENCDLYGHHPKYRATGFDHIEDMSGTWGVIEGKSVCVDDLQVLGLHESVAKYLKELEGKLDEVRRFVAEPLRCRKIITSTHLWPAL